MVAVIIQIRRPALAIVWLLGLMIESFGPHLKRTKGFSYGMSAQKCISSVMGGTIPTQQIAVKIRLATRYRMHTRPVNQVRYQALILTFSHARLESLRFAHITNPITPSNPAAASSPLGSCHAHPLYAQQQAAYRYRLSSSSPRTEA